MKNRAFKIQYSLVVNGEEYPRSITLVDKDSEAAIQQLKDMVRADHAEVRIAEVIPV